MGPFLSVYHLRSLPHKVRWLSSRMLCTEVWNCHQTENSQDSSFVNQLHNRDHYFRDIDGYMVVGLWRTILPFFLPDNFREKIQPIGKESGIHYSCVWQVKTLAMKKVFQGWCNHTFGWIGLCFSFFSYTQALKYILPWGFLVIQEKPAKGIETGANGHSIERHWVLSNRFCINSCLPVLTATKTGRRDQP